MDELVSRAQEVQQRVWSASDDVTVVDDGPVEIRHLLKRWYSSVRISMLSSSFRRFLTHVSCGRQQSGERCKILPASPISPCRDSIAEIPCECIFHLQGRAYSNNAAQPILCSPLSRMRSPSCKIVLPQTSYLDLRGPTSEVQEGR